MTTARDWLNKFLGSLVAGKFMDEIVKAPEPVRLDLAALLNPWRPAESAPIDGAPFLAELHGNTYAIVFHDPRIGDPDWVWRTEDGIGYHRDALTRWMPLPLPAPPSEDK